MSNALLQHKERFISKFFYPSIFPFWESKYFYYPINSTFVPPKEHKITIFSPYNRGFRLKTLNYRINSRCEMKSYSVIILESGRWYFVFSDCRSALRSTSVAIYHTPNVVCFSCSRFKLGVDFCCILKADDGERSERTGEESFYPHIYERICFSRYSPKFTNCS